MKIFLLLFFALALAVPTTAQKGYEAKSEWDEFRFTDYDREVAAGLREVQQLLQGRESLLQSYERSDQSAIATERNIEKLQQDRINSEKVRLSYYEAMVNFKFPESEYDEQSPIDEPIDDDEEFRKMLEQVEQEVYLEKYKQSLLSAQTPRLPLPPRIRIRSLLETSDGISIEIENLGDSIDALISVADSQGTIIGTPYQAEVMNWDDPRWLSFQLLSRSDKINLLIQSAAGKNYRIPLFIREQITAVRIMAFPFEQTAKVGESVEYQIVIEGDGNDRQRYPMKISNLPNAIAWQIAKIIPRWIGAGSATTPEGQVRSVPIRNLMFSSAFNRHELVLQLTLGKDLPKRLIGKPISFTLRIGQIRESLSITPMGVGEITIDLPQVVSARIGESKRVFVSLRNIGTEIVSGIEIRPIGTTYGVTLTTGDAFSLAADEHREILEIIKAQVNDSLSPIRFKDKNAEHFFGKTVVTSSKGIPIVAVQMCQKARGTKQVSLTFVREELMTAHKASVKYIDLTPLILIAVGLIGALRYIGRGMGNQELYIIAGTLGQDRVRGEFDVLLDHALGDYTRVTGELKIRYWRQKDGERNQSES